MVLNNHITSEEEARAFWRKVGYVLIYYEIITKTEYYSPIRCNTQKVHVLVFSLLIKLHCKCAPICDLQNQTSQFEHSQGYKEDLF